VSKTEVFEGPATFDADIAIGGGAQPLPLGFERITVLYVRNAAGALLGYYFHPNSEALADKERSLREEHPSWDVHRVTYHAIEGNA
jgi:hypothetical protein